MKDKIIERLLKEGNITTKEAIILLKETEGFSKTLPYEDMSSLGNYIYHTTSNECNNGPMCHCNGDCK